MTDLLRAAPSHEASEPDLTKEWLVTNGLGGYASSTVVGILTRRYHGLLISALPNPLGRYMMLNALEATLETPEGKLAVGPPLFSTDQPVSQMSMSEFRLVETLPVWEFKSQGYRLERRLLLNYYQNTVLITYVLHEAPAAVKLHLRPGINFRPHDTPVNAKLADRYTVNMDDRGYEISTGVESICLRMRCDPSSTFIPEIKIRDEITFLAEARRGYESVGSIYSPGFITMDLAVGQQITFIASTESWDTIQVLSPDEGCELSRQRRRALLQSAPVSIRTGVGAELVLAADQFLTKPVGRRKDEVWARAAGDEVRTVMAGYFWFADWGRDTMISLEGLSLTTGRYAEAAWILRTFAHYIRWGLIPNMFPEGKEEGLYHTADASLWFFHALSRYLDHTGDITTLKLLVPKLQEIIDAHLNGTKFGIHVDTADSLLTQGAPGYQLTWMDAKVGDWVVTPRRGKAVEINALWYNALCCMSAWMAQLNRKDEADNLASIAQRARESFNKRFWCEAKGHLYDVVDGENGGDDASCRPNQIFAISLPNPVLDESRWPQVVDVVTKELLTPVGLRSLSPSDPNYKPKYDGDLRSRDAAYHQGTVWGWLIGPYVDAWMKLHPHETKTARGFLDGFVAHLDEACIGSISEIFDGEPPHTPRACIAQAWSVAEVVRCWVKTNS